VKDVGFLRQVVDFQRWIDSQANVAKTTSIATIIGELHQALEGRDIDKYERIPESSDAVAQQLFLYSMSLPVGMGINYWTTMDHKKMRIKVLWTVENSEETIARIEEIKAKAAEMGLNLTIAGKTALVPQMSHYILDTFNDANFRALIMILITMIFLCRSLRYGSLAMLPNAIPPIFAGGVMYLLGVNYDVGTVLVISVVMGIAVDDTVHFMTHFQDQVRQGKTHREAIIEVFDRTGFALLITNVVLTIGFGAAMFSEFLPFRNFGLMTVISLIFALVADWMLLPALLMTPVIGYRRNSKQ
jgi:predicted RND superfamily exporter protein